MNHTPTNDHSDTNQDSPATERADCVIITAPSWFEREDFRRWLRTKGLVATWDEGGESMEYSDAFITFDRRGEGPLAAEQIEGSNFNGDGECAMPTDIEDQIKAAVRAQTVSHGVVWIKPT